MNFTPKQIFTNVVTRKILIVAYVIFGIWEYCWLYIGQSNFITTAYTYSLIGIVMYFLLLKVKASPNVFLIVFSIFFSLFAAEFILRFIVRYPISYGEQNGMSYVLPDRYGEFGNWRFMYMKSRKDVHTLEFDSGEIRDNDCGEYVYPDDTCNALGFRGKLPDKSKKITLLLGDSFTEGAGAPADSSIPELLRKQLYLIDTSSDVLNAGIAGNDIFFDWKMVHKLKDKYELKTLIFVLNTTDINDVATRGGNERFLPNGRLSYPKRPLWESIYALSFVSRLFAHNVLELDYNLQTTQERINEEEIAIKKIVLLIKNDIAPWTKQKGLDLLFVVHPLKHEFEGNAVIYEKLVFLLRGIDGLKVIDCMPELKKQASSEDLYWKLDGHFKPAGYNIIAKVVIDSCYR